MEQNPLFLQFVQFVSAVHDVTNTMTKGVRPDWITPVQYSILEYLMVNQPVTLSQISDCQHMSMPNTSRELRKLMEKGLCVKFVDDVDRRKQLFELTAQGKSLMAEAFSKIEARLSEKLQGLSKDELEQISQALHTLQSTVFHTNPASS